MEDVQLWFAITEVLMKEERTSWVDVCRVFYSGLNVSTLCVTCEVIWDENVWYYERNTDFLAMDKYLPLTREQISIPFFKALSFIIEAES